MDSPCYDDPAHVVENKGFESSKSRELGAEVDDAKEATDHSTVEPIRVVHTSVTERVIFCIDSNINPQANHSGLVNTIHSYMDLKSQLAVKPVEYAIIIMGDEVSVYLPVPSTKELNNVIVALSKLKADETQPFDFTEAFKRLAENVELPDPRFYGDLPPPHVYHVIIIFGRNMFIPTIKSANAYYFLMESPYVALDILYLPRPEIPKNKSTKIAKALKTLVDENKGFFEMCPQRKTTTSMSKVINRLLGHTLMRFPQKSAIFDYKELIAASSN